MGMKLLTVKELGEYLNVKAKTLYQWAELGQIPCLKVNGTLRFDPRRIDSWLQTCAREPRSSYNPLTKLEVRKGGLN